VRSPAEQPFHDDGRIAGAAYGAHGWLGPALEWLANDELIAFPTETVWGLAARAESPRAFERMRSWKERGGDRPVSVLVAGPESLEGLGAELGAAAHRLVRAYWPGPLTLVVRCRRELAAGVAGAGGALGLRCSSHPVAAELARAAQRRGLGLLTASSLNRSGEEPARNRSAARLLCSELGGTTLLQLPGEAGGAAPSTVVDATGREPRVLREGAIPAGAIAATAAAAERRNAAHAEPKIGSDRR
jgi:L-threonylcarbamoyladenylate synthase